MRRPLDLAAFALVLAAGLFVVEATWQPPLVSPAEAAVRIGERVRMEGMALDVRRFSDGAGRLVLAADGAAVHVRLAAVGDIQENDWVLLEGTVRREGGLPLLEASSASLRSRPDTERVSLAAVAAHPQRFEQTLVSVQGHVQRNTVEADGHRLTMDGEAPAGYGVVHGVLRYEARCLCYTLHVAPWTS